MRQRGIEGVNFAAMVAAVTPEAVEAMEAVLATILTSRWWLPADLTTGPTLILVGKPDDFTLSKKLADADALEISLSWA